MEENKNELSFTALWRIFKRCWILMVVAAVIALSAAAVVSWVTHVPVYSASAKIWVFRNREIPQTEVDAAQGDSTGEQKSEVKSEAQLIYENLVVDFYNAQVGEALLPDCMDILKSETVISRTLERFAESSSDLPVPTEKEFASMLRISVVPDTTRLIKIAVVSESKEVAYRLATIWSEVFREYMNEELMNGQSYIQIADEATIPTNEANPISRLKIALVGVAAAALVYAGFLIQYLTNDKINTPEDVKYYLDMNILGAIPAYHGSGSGKHAKKHAHRKKKANKKKKSSEKSDDQQ